MSYLALFFLGQPRIELNGAVVKIPLHKALALLSYLAVTDESHGREALSAFFWPEHSQDAALNTLRVNLHTLRKTLGPEWFVVDRDTIGLSRDSNLWVDVRYFRNLLAGLQSHDHSASVACKDCISPLSEAIHLYRGNFLTGFTLQDSMPFDDWQRLQDILLRQEATEALKQLAHCHGAQKEFGQAIAYAQQWLAFDPLNESAHRALMQLYAWSDQRSAALNQYQECAQILEKELGELPLKETEELFQSIKEYHLPPPPSLADLVETPARPIFNTATTPFLGRTKELAEVAKTLREPACRLLNLIGPSGIGKTRLALQVAAENGSVFPNGIWYIPLVAVNSTELLATAIIEALNISLDGKVDIKAQLFNHLRNRKALLILDNFEHLINGADLIAEVLKMSSGIKVMVTSCERLNLQLEWLYPVRGLEYPENEAVAIEEYSAVQLFLQSARRANAGFTLSKMDRPHIVRICQFLDGMPLGIELAATWTQMLSCQEIDGEIGQDLDFLSVRDRDVPERHRSLRAVFEHSWKLLSDDEKKIIKKLSVFHNGFHRKAAEQIAVADLVLLSSLTNKSFLHPTLTGRYEILETLRKYVGEKLEENGQEHENIHDRHAEYYAGFLKVRETQLKGGRQLETLKEIFEDIENIRVAWRWMVSHGKLLEIDQSQESLHLFYNMRSWIHEGVDVFGSAVQKLRSMSIDEKYQVKETRLILARLLARQGYFYDRIGRYDMAKELLQESLAIFSELKIQDETAMSLRGLARVSLDMEDYAEARRLYQACLGICEKNDDQWGIVRCLDSLGFIYLYLEEYSEARIKLEKGILISKEMGDQWGMAWCLMDLGFLTLIQKEYEEAQQVLQECLSTCKKIGDWQGVATTLSYLALVAVGQGEYEEARLIYQREIGSWQELGYQLGVACAHMELGFFLFMLEEYGEARQYLQEALDTALVLQSVPTVVRSLAGITALSIKEGKSEEAFELIKRTLYHPAVYGKVKDVNRQLFSSADLSLQVYAQHNTILYREFMNGIQEINKAAKAIAFKP